MSNIDRESLNAAIELHDSTDQGGTEPDADLLHHALTEIQRLREDCSELYQVIGYLAGCGGLFDTVGVQCALDNALAASDGDERPHDDLLPFAPSKGDPK